jgi:Pentapeptide repeats (8 copies)
LRAHLIGANLQGADLGLANLVEADLTSADLSGSRIFGVSAWRVKLGGTKQRDLIISADGEPRITVDHLEVAQFIDFLLHNEKIRDAIDTIGKKAVLILGRFTPERKVVLDAVRDELRKLDYLPIIFDFDKPAGKDLTGSVTTLANMARFIVADLTDPSSIPYELAIVVPTTMVPVQPIILSAKSEFAMFDDLRKRHHWVLKPYRYDTPLELIANLADRVISPAEAKASGLRNRI